MSAAAHDLTLGDQPAPERLDDGFSPPEPPPREQAPPAGPQPVEPELPEQSPF